MSTPPLFLLDELPAPGGLARLAGAEGRHAATVRRMRAGETVLVGDGRGGRARAEVSAVHGDGLTVRVTDCQRVPRPALRVVLVQALLKGERGELAVELATEAGVDAVLPWRATRCVARWAGGPRGERALARWRSAAREAAKLSRRAWVPEVLAPEGTAALVRRMAGAGATLLLHERASIPLRAAELPAEGELLLIVGPEGGVTVDEQSVLAEAGALPVRLGPDVLRACTAGAVALGALGVLTERWEFSRHPGEGGPSMAGRG